MTTSAPRQVEVQLDTGLRPDVKKLSLLFAGIGSVIGSGWVFGALAASQLAGPLAIFAWVIGGLMFIVIGLAYAELGVMFPVAGPGIAVAVALMLVFSLINRPRSRPGSTPGPWV